MRRKAAQNGGAVCGAESAGRLACTKKVKSKSKIYNGKPTKFFDAGSPGFLYAVITAALTIFAASGVTFPKAPADLGTELVSSFSLGGIYALIGIIIASVAFPIYNAVKAGTFTFKGVFSRNPWIAIGNAVAAGIALTGFVLPAGTTEQIIGAISMKDWGGLISITGLTVVNTLIRFLKERTADKCPCKRS